MYSRKPKEKQPVDHAIDATFNAYNPEDDDAHKHLKSLKQLYALRNTEKRKGPSSDTILMVAGNLVGIAMIVGHERASVVTSKGMQFIKQFR